MKGFAWVYRSVRSRRSIELPNFVPRAFTNTIAAGIIATVLAGQAVPQRGPGDTEGSGRKPVLVELFTSEGCSSCPPADRFLERLDKSQPMPGIEIVAMSEHVDYWNHDGWVDPFSSADLTRRQQDYARRLNLPEVYTPQIVIDGFRQCVGSSEADAAALIRKAAEKPKLDLRMRDGARPGTVEIDVKGGSDGHGGGDVYIAFADDEAQSDVLSGENRGMKLHHIAIVRKLRKIGKLDKPAEFKREVPVSSFGRGRLIAFVQDPGSGAVTGVGLYRIESEPTK